MTTDTDGTRHHPVSAAPGQRWRSTYRGEDRVVLVLRVEPSLDRRGLVATVRTVWRAGRAVDGPTTRIALDAAGRLPRYRLETERSTP